VNRVVVFKRAPLPSEKEKNYGFTIIDRWAILTQRRKEHRETQRKNAASLCALRASALKKPCNLWTTTIFK
jgi:hypothetical protein